ncbi:MAG: hypothetical protein WBP08_00425 [Saprospiraceae bacterium]
MMIKLFRNIRQKLLNVGSPDYDSRAGKISKYLKYAFGEIIKCPFRDYLLVALNIKTAHCAFRYKI